MESNSLNKISWIKEELKVFLDDEREAPQGWRQVRWPDEVYMLMHDYDVTHLSLDHDLGDDVRGTGYDVLLYIEELVYRRRFKPPIIYIHTANPAAREKMEAALESIRREWHSIKEKGLV